MNRLLRAFFSVLLIGVSVSLTPPRAVQAPSGFPVSLSDMMTHADVIVRAQVLKADSANKDFCT